MKDNFNTLNLRAELADNLSEIGFKEMTPIQKGALPKILKGLDIIGQAKTGSGKTAAFGLGILNKISVKNPSTKSLILCPTRELAEQVAIELRRLARKLSNLKVLTVTGGVGYNHQERSLEHGAHIIVGTPGRVAKLMKTGFIQLQALETFVLDEADRMLDMGFSDEIMNIEEQLPNIRQTLLFSATFPDDVISLGENIQKEAEFIKVDSQHVKGNIEQHFYKLDSHKDKNQAILKILGAFNPQRLIIFCKTKIITDKLADFLNRHDIFAESIHGDLDQSQRTKVLTQFSNSSLSILVATDVAARGIDIKDLGCVINYDLPIDSEDYIHRIGRTGRAGKSGLAFSLFVEAEQFKIDDIQKEVEDELVINSLDLDTEILPYTAKPSMETIFISGGKKDKLRPGDLLGALIKEAGLEPSDVGDISILPIVSYIAIKREKASIAIDKLSQGKIKNRKFRIGFI